MKYDIMVKQGTNPCATSCSNEKYNARCYSSGMHVLSFTAVLFVVETVSLAGHSDISHVLDKDNNTRTAP